LFFLFHPATSQAGSTFPFIFLFPQSVEDVDDGAARACSRPRARRAQPEWRALMLRRLWRA
jgi:hypothetical protein